MTATATNTETKALLEPPRAPSAPKAEKIVKVARQFDVSPLRQWREMTQLLFGPGKLPSYEYYNCGLYDPAIPMEEKKQYVAVKGSWLINKELTPKHLCQERGFVGNKVLFTSLIDRLGFRTTETQAVISDKAHFGSIPHLDTPAAMRTFLLEKARFPLFGKPLNYSGSFGSALIDRVEGEDVVLSNGTRLGLDAFCREIVQEYGEGFLFQSAITQHQELTDIIGRAIVQHEHMFRLTGPFSSPRIGITLVWVFLPVACWLLARGERMNLRMVGGLLTMAATMVLVYVSGERMATLFVGCAAIGISLLSHPLR